MMKREEIIKIIEEELDNQPMASQKVLETSSALESALEEYVEAIQADAFYFGYLTAKKKCRVSMEDN